MQAGGGIYTLLRDDPLRQRVPINQGRIGPICTGGRLAPLQPGLVLGIYLPSLGRHDLYRVRRWQTHRHVPMACMPKHARICCARWDHTPPLGLPQSTRRDTGSGDMHQASLGRTWTVGCARELLHPTCQYGNYRRTFRDHSHFQARHPHSQCCTPHLTGRHGMRQLLGV